MIIEIFDENEGASGSWYRPLHDDRIAVQAGIRSAAQPRYMIREVNGELQIEAADGGMFVQPISGHQIIIKTHRN